MLLAPDITSAESAPRIRGKPDLFGNFILSVPSGGSGEPAAKSRWTHALTSQQLRTENNEQATQEILGKFQRNTQVIYGKRRNETAAAITAFAVRS
jgi:hypothetical protein